MLLRALHERLRVQAPQTPDQLGVVHILPLRHIQENVEMVVENGVRDNLNATEPFHSAHQITQSALFAVIDDHSAIHDSRHDVVVPAALLNDPRPSHFTTSSLLGFRPTERASAIKKQFGFPYSGKSATLCIEGVSLTSLSVLRIFS